MKMTSEGSIEDNYEKDEDIRYLEEFNDYKYQKYNKACMYGILFVSLVILVALACSGTRDHCRHGNQESQSKPNQKFTRNLPENSIKTGYNRNRGIGEMNIMLNELKAIARYENCDISICAVLNAKCSNTSTEMNDIIIKEYIENDCEFCDLQIFNVIFPDKTIKKDWLDADIFVHELNIGFRNDYYCLKLEEGIFNSQQFKAVTTLTFSGSFDECQTTKLNRNILKGLENVYVFNIQPSKYNEVQFEDKLFEMFLSLTTLQLQRCISSPEAVKALTGDSVLSSVQIVDFRFNDKITTLVDYAFAGLPNVMVIYLDDCKISFVDDYVFDGLTQLKTISLQNNLLKSLSHETFKDYTAPNLLYLKNNPFICTCDLKWLKEVASESSDYRSVQCSYGKPPKINLSEFIEGCLEESTEAVTSSTPNPTTNSTPTTVTTTLTSKPTTQSTPTTAETTSTSTPTTTTEGTPTTVSTLKTTPITGPTLPITTPSTGTTSTETTVTEMPEPTSTISTLTPGECVNTMKPRSFPPMSISSGYDKIIIHFNESLPEWPHLIYKAGDDVIKTEDFGCVGTKIAKEWTIQNVIADTSYVLCLKNKSEGSVSPYDCMATKTLPSPEKRIWLLEEDRSNAYLIIACSIACSVALAGGGLYYTLRKYPNLLKNDKIVVITPRKEIKNPSILFPRRDPIFFDPRGELRIDQKINQVYLSPIGGRSLVRQRGGSFSENSSGTNTLASYVPVIEPTPNQLLSWRIGTLNKTRENEIYQGTLPPPIPPPRRPSNYSNVYDRLEYHEYF